MEVKFGVVGTAYWATAVHTIGLQCTQGARLVGIWGRDKGKASELAKARGVSSFATFDEMLAAVDAVSFAVPPEVQGDLALRAMLARKHVLLEKPIATGSGAASSLVKAAEQNKLATIVFLMRRFVPEIADFLAHNAAYEWRSADIEVRSAAFASQSPYRNSLWRQAPGSEYWDVGPHVLSIAIPMLGPVVRARLLDPEGIYSRFETEHQGGAVARVKITQHSEPSETRNLYQFRGPQGMAIVPDPQLDRPANFIRAATALVEQIQDNRHTHPCDVRFGAEIVRILERMTA